MTAVLSPASVTRTTARWPVILLRAATTGVAVLVLLQAALAGSFLSGRFEAPAAHAGNSGFVGVLVVVQSVAAIFCWTYDGSFPGPTIVTRSGRRTVVRHRNELPRPTVVHLHGGHTPADSDGYPMDVIVPMGHGHTAAHAGHAARHLTHGYRDYNYPHTQRAATLWYHDHGHGVTGYMVWQGPAGFHIVHDDEEDALGLPGGDHDIPLMIADRSFAADGSFRYPLADPHLQSPVSPTST